MGARFEGPLARLFGDGPVAGLTDGQLLDQFANRFTHGDSSFVVLWLNWRADNSEPEPSDSLASTLR